jgi:hypothetical protein
MTFETVIAETPAAFATSWIVAMLAPGQPVVSGGVRR